MGSYLLEVALDLFYKITFTRHIFTFLSYTRSKVVKINLKKNCLDHHSLDSFKALYETSQMFCFTTQCYQNKTYEKPRMRRRTRLSMSRNTGLYLLTVSIKQLGLDIWKNQHCLLFFNSRSLEQPGLIIKTFEYL